MGSPLSPIISKFFIEHSEEMALEGATHKPLCWFRYVDDTFVIWSHEPDKLIDFLSRLNSVYENIRFTMETERDSHLPILDIDIYREPDGSLGHTVYGNPHTLTSICHHHPSNKRAVQSTLVHWARTLYDRESLEGELKFLRATFRQNGYSDRQIRRALSPPKRVAPPPEKTVSVAFLPFVRISRMLSRNKPVGFLRERVPESCEGRLGTQDSRHAQHALRMWSCLHWADRLFH
jgi:hypothetical protein